MTCKEVREIIAEYLDELLPLERKLALEKHLRACVYCRQLITETKTAVQWLQQAEKITPPTSLRISVLKTLQQEKQVRSTRLAPGLVQIVAAAAAFVLLIASNILPLADGGYLRTRGNADSVATYDNINQKIDIRSSEAEKQVMETAGEPEQSLEHGELAAVNEQRQTDVIAQRRLTPRLILNLGLVTTIMILLIWANKKRKELLP